MAYRPSRIRDAISALPAKPGAIIAVCLIAATIGVYYFNNYRSCTAHRDFRDRFVAAAAEAAQDNAAFALGDVVDYEWAEVSILGERELQGRKLDCPLGWDWSWEERAALASAGDLAVMLFSSAEGTYIDFVDVQRSVVEFAEMPARYLRNDARFTATASGSNPEHYLVNKAP